MVLKQNKICGKKLLTLTDVQLPINFLEHDALLDTPWFIETLLLFYFFKAILSMAMYVSNLDFFIL